MNSENESSTSLPSRREFLKNSGKVVAGAALAGAMVSPGYAAEKNTIKIALVGCGGRGTGAAANALSTAGPTKLWAVADGFEQRVASILATLSGQLAKQVEVSPERRFVGFDAFKHAIDSLDKGDVVLLATPPAFRPIHFEYAVQKGIHVFMEKSFAVDAPGIRRVLRTGELARQKNLKVASGLMSRHYKPLEEAVQEIHDGRIGEVITAWAYRMHGPVGIGARQPDTKELAYQIANYSCFTWLNGSFIVDWLIHNIDVCCWVKNAWPVSVQGMGGRQVRGSFALSPQTPLTPLARKPGEGGLGGRGPQNPEADQLFDHYAAEFTFPDGTRLFAQGRHISNCWDFFGDLIHGTKGCAVLGEGITNPRLYKTHRQTPENLSWKYQGPPCVHYQVEHDLLFDAIRNDKPYNETERSAKSCFTAIMGRMACESGQLITWEEALASDLELAPGLEHYTFDSKAPVEPDAHGRYPVAIPGQTKVL